MGQPKIMVVVPTIRPEQFREFRDAWWPLIDRHEATLITVWDGESPFVTEQRRTDEIAHPARVPFDPKDADLFCRRTDACRNLGFVAAACLRPEFILTLDDDVRPPAGSDPIQEHLDVLAKRVPLSWMNTAMPVDHSWGGAFKNGDTPYLRGVPYGVRDEAPVMLSHGVWVNVPDFDGQSQLELEAKGPLPYTLPYYRGPIPRGVLFPMCGMNVMVRREALPYFYFAPMGADSGHPELHRMADIFAGLYVKREFDQRRWAFYTGASTVIHTRASDARKNADQEKLGRQWLEEIWGDLGNCKGRYCPRWKYFDAYADKRTRYAALINSLLGTP